MFKVIKCLLFNILQNKIYSTLVMYRITLAQQSDCMPYMIASNKLLIDVAKLKPKHISELKNGKKNDKLINLKFKLLSLQSIYFWL